MPQPLQPSRDRCDQTPDMFEVLAAKVCEECWGGGVTIRDGAPADCPAGTGYVKDPPQPIPPPAPKGNKMSDTKKTRVYRYTDKTAPGKDRLIRAVSLAGATAFAVKDRDTSKIASQDDMAELLSAGVKIEDATAEPAQ